MTKQEFFRQSVEKLPRRSQNVILAEDITCDNIHLYNYTRLMTIRNCGKRTVTDILNLAKAIRDKYSIDLSQSTEDANSEEQILFKSFELSTRTKRALQDAKIFNFHDLKKAADDKFAIIRVQRNIGKHTISELYDLCEYMEGQIALGNLHEDTIDLPTVSRYNAVKSKEIDILLEDLYYQLLNQLSSIQIEHIGTTYNSFMDVFSVNLSYIHINTSSRLTKESVMTDLRIFRDKFLAQAEIYLSMPFDEARRKATFSRLSYLSADDRVFVDQFYEREHHLPMFYLLCKALTETSSDAESKAPSVYAEYIGLTGGKRTKAELSEHFQITQERVRQIVSHFKETEFVRCLPFVDKSSWDSYSFLRNEYITVENSDFLALSMKEKLSIDFSAFCHLCALAKPLYDVLEIFKDENDDFTSSFAIKRNVAIVCTYVYAYDGNAKHYYFVKALQYINRQIKLVRNKEVTISLSDLCNDPNYWYNNIVQQGNVGKVYYLMETIIQDTLNIKTEDDKITIPANRIDVEGFLYEYLSKKGDVASIDELFKAYKETYPNSSQTDPKQLRPYLYNHDKIIPVGRKSLFSVAGASNFCGNLSELVMSIISSADEPIKRTDICKEAIRLRPDTNPASIRTTIHALQKTKEILSYKRKYVILNSAINSNPNIIIEKIDDIVRKNFAERVEELRLFVREMQRMPLANGPSSEQSLLRWYYRIGDSLSSLSDENYLLFNELTKEIMGMNIPMNTEEWMFKQKIELYKERLVNSMSPVKRTEDVHLYEWFNKNLRRYNKLDTRLRIYFDELLDVLKTFGFDFTGVIAMYE